MNHTVETANHSEPAARFRIRRPRELAADLLNGPEHDGVIAGDLTGVRILVLMPSIPVQGMERSNLQIMKMMRERGAVVLFVTVDRYGERVQREVERIGCSWVTAPFEGRLSLAITPGRAAKLFSRFAATARRLRQIYKDFSPTCVHVTNSSYLLFAIPFLCRINDPVVFRLPNPPETRLSPTKQWISNLLWQRCVAPLCDVIVCNSQYSRKQIEAIGVCGRRVQVIHNCVPERSRPEKSDAPVLDSNCFNIVYLGRIRPEKGVRELVAAAAQLTPQRKDVCFYLIGENSWQNPFAEKLAAELRCQGLSPRVRLIDQIEDVDGVLSQADLHVCPSTSASESFPNVVLEAKKHSVPSVVFPTAGLPEAVTHLVDGYLCVECSSAALYGGIRYYLDNPEVLKRARQCALQSLDRFSPTRIGNQWAEVFRRGRNVA